MYSESNRKCCLLTVEFQLLLERLQLLLERLTELTANKMLSAVGFCYTNRARSFLFQHMHCPLTCACLTASVTRAPRFTRHRATSPKKALGLAATSNADLPAKGLGMVGDCRSYAVLCLEASIDGAAVLGDGSMSAVDAALSVPAGCEVDMSAKGCHALSWVSAAVLSAVCALSAAADPPDVIFCIASSAGVP